MHVEQSRLCHRSTTCLFSTAEDVTHVEHSSRSRATHTLVEHSRNKDPTMSCTCALSKVDCVTGPPHACSAQQKTSDATITHAEHARRSQIEMPITRRSSGCIFAWSVSVVMAIPNSCSALHATLAHVATAKEGCNVRGIHQGSGMKFTVAHSKKKIAQTLPNSFFSIKNEFGRV